jgi:hypothetical protein
MPVFKTLPCSEKNWSGYLEAAHLQIHADFYQIHADIHENLKMYCKATKRMQFTHYQWHLQPM